MKARRPLVTRLESLGRDESCTRGCLPLRSYCQCRRYAVLLLRLLRDPALEIRAGGCVIEFALQLLVGRVQHIHELIPNQEGFGSRPASQADRRVGGTQGFPREGIDAILEDLIRFQRGLLREGVSHLKPDVEVVLAVLLHFGVERIVRTLVDQRGDLILEPSGFRRDDRTP